MSNPEQIQRIMFDELDIRGVLVGLESSYQEILALHEYPVAIRNALGEMLAAVALLGTTLKFEGRVLLQAQGSGNVQILMAEINHRGECRAVSRYEGDVAENLSAVELIEDGHLVITIEPDDGQRYQGIVPLEKETLSGCLTDYFLQSEQLPTQIHLAADGNKAAGFLLQVMPAAGTSDSDWEHISQIGATLKSEELLSLDNETLLYRLFHQEACRLYDPDTLVFKCDCSRERSMNALQFLTQDELLEMLEEQGSIEVGCQFCNALYRFDEADIRAQFSDTAHIPQSDQLH
ncbi:Hsp33 family molecular chaperone HslO [Neptunomonas concharum]|uniref:33 kDa chaperonin n=1 Tax=Neptunomonas concharum TaxID=1031538 RepID=A0A5P1RG03_9GAMM|nr:Hsp33 family molecular chaperone HslO [Neptunomonas concharum]QEQ98111.1 Hsp33 family molecular chaperone HslO [Neptunomonas concharum]